MKSNLKIEKTSLLKLTLLLLLFPLYSLSMAQFVSTGGGKVGVDISTGDPGGPWGPGLSEPKICLQVGTCDTLVLSDFTANYLLFIGEDGASIPGISYRVLGWEDGDYLIEFCIEANTQPGLVVVNMSDFDMGGELVSTETPFWTILGCISLDCPDCVYEDPNATHH